MRIFTQQIWKSIPNYLSLGVIDINVYPGVLLIKFWGKSNALYNEPCQRSTLLP